MLRKLAQSFFPCPPLITSIIEGNLELVRQLLEEGADVNVADKDGVTPLLVAIRCGGNLLTGEGKIINDSAYESCKEAVGRFVFGYYEKLDAAEGMLKEINYDERLKIIELLLKWEADVNVVDKFENTPLFCAMYNMGLATCNNAGIGADVAMMLIREGADINLVDKHGSTLLISAIRHEGKKATDLAIELIRRGVDVNLVNIHGNTPLLAAIESKKTDVAMELIRRGADVNLVGIRRAIPLLAAIRHGGKKGTDIAMELIRRGANVNANSCMITPLIAAIGGMKTDVVMELIRKGADVNLVSRSGDIPLYCAAQSRKLIVVRKILEQEINLDMRDRENYLMVVRNLYTRSKVDNPEDFKILSHREKLKCFNIMYILGYLAMFTSISVLRENLSTPKAICFLDAFDKKLYSLISR